MQWGGKAYTYEMPWEGKGGVYDMLWGGETEGEPEGEEERKGNPKKKIPPSFDALRRRWCLVSSREGKKTRIATTREDKNNKNKNNNDDARHRHRNENERNGKHHLIIFFFFFSRLIYPGKSRKKKGVTSDSGKGLGVFGARIARGPSACSPSTGPGCARAPRGSPPH